MTVNVATPSSHSYQDRPVGWFLFATAFWAFLAATGAMTLALLLVAPKLFYELGDTAQHFSFAGLFPPQMNWVEPNLVVAMLAVWGLLFAEVIGRTLSLRGSEQRLSVPVWFVLAVGIAVPAVLVLGNGADLFGSNYQGVQDAMMQWWSSRGLVTFLMSVPAVGMLYFMVPSIGSGRIYSHCLSAIHFWSIALLGCWGGNFQCHFTALPEWADSIATFAGMILWLGCLAGAYNLWQSYSVDLRR